MVQYEKTIPGRFKRVNNFIEEIASLNRPDYNEWTTTGSDEYWGRWCPECMKYLDYIPVKQFYSASFHTRCLSPNHGLKELDNTVAIRPNSANLIADSFAPIFQRTWWFATRAMPHEVEWDKVNYLHCKTGALHQAISLGMKDVEYQIYSVKLPTTTSVDPIVWVEDHVNSVLEMMPEHPDAYEITRYVNSWESAGDISLYLRDGLSEPGFHEGHIMMTKPDNNNYVKELTVKDF